MATDICTRRLTKELSALKKEPISDPTILVEPNESNILEMHYVIEGSKGTPYEGGVYHGKLLFPKEYPLKPPGVMMCTPSGRFQPNRRLCLSMSDFHPESWNPMWSVSTILTGLYSFMIESNPTLGSIETTTTHKRKLAAQSLEYNCRDKTFCRLFPDYVELWNEQKKLRPAETTTVTAPAPVSSAAVPALGRMPMAAAIVAILSIVLAMRGFL